MFIKKVYDHLTSMKWTIGFVENPLGDIIEGKELSISWMQHNYKDRWFADPFVLDVTKDFIYLLVEEFYLPINRAHIAKLTIDKSTKKLLKTDPILKLNTHLSYPAIIRRDNHIYIYPESGQSGKLKLYEFFPESNEMQEKICLIDGDVGDATYTNLFGEDLIFCTIPPKYNEDELHVFKKMENGKYQDSETICFKDNVGRMAGDFFSYKNRIFRPAQDCNIFYGNGIVIQEIKRENDKWLFDEIVRYYSPNKYYPIGFHTLNMYNDTIVVDALGFQHYYIGTSLNNLNHCIKHLLHK